MSFNGKKFNKIILVFASICGLTISVSIGIGTYRQASPNFDSRNTIAATKTLLANTKTGSIAEIKAIGVGLSPYNRKVANSRLLTHYNRQDFSKLADSELLTLKDHYKETAVKLFAVREYGFFMAIGVVVFSMGLTVTTVWLLIYATVFVFLRLRGFDIIGRS